MKAASKNLLPVLFSVILAAVVLAPTHAHPDICVSDAWSNGSIPSQILFPNWYRVKVASYDVWLCYGCTWQTNEILTSLTVVNFGTAGGGDIASVFWVAHCGATTTGTMTMTYRGMYTEDSGAYPAWTWNGSSINLAGCADLCGAPACGGWFTIDVFANVASCPTDGATVNLGFPIHEASNTTWWGSIYDDADCTVPWYDLMGEEHTILYAYKSGWPAFAAPGDQVYYDIYYGRPGANPIDRIILLDTIPPYTHYVGGSASPAPDTSWDPDWGPPVRLKWTLNGPFAVTGGVTDMVTFQVSVDWGNGEGFEPGSGDVAAPEGARLNNQAQVFWESAAWTCPTKTKVNPPVKTVVRRFLFWKFGDNDVLYSPTLGQNPDEMIYSIFIKNMSGIKTWWNVDVWDTVPTDLSTWEPDCGLEDRCMGGWTMTPMGGCADANGGYFKSGANTVLTWRLTMPPNMTINLKWKAKVKGTASAGSTAINQAAVLARGRTGIVNGTGHSGVPRRFTHLAPIILPTMYVSYVGYYAATDDKGECPGFYISFFPLNKKSQFELRGLQYQGAGWATTGGVSASIGSLIGDCLNGFPGGGGLPGGGIPGCRAERTPAKYDPAGWIGMCPTYPFEAIYKITSNSPVLWQLLTHITSSCQDRQLFAPATTLSYAGLMHYFWRNEYACDTLDLINTSVDAYGAFDKTLATTVHLFSFDYTDQAWDYRTTYEIDGESQAFDLVGGADTGPWRSVSSDTRIIAQNAAEALSNCGCCVCNGDNHESFMPARETGNTVSLAGSGHLYGILQGKDMGHALSRKLTIGNVGPNDATVHIYQYLPNNTLAPPAAAPNLLRDTGGSWRLVASTMVPAGQATAGNPACWGNGGIVLTGYSTLFKVEVSEGGPIQVLHGGNLYSIWAGGAVMHAANGDQTGTEFWLNYHGGRENSSPVVQLYCPKKDMVVQAVYESGYSAHYTSTGPDQCILFKSIPGYGEADNRDNLKFYVLPGPSFGDVMSQFIQANVTEKGYTAPFLSTGTHYFIIAPPIVYSGQDFWITVVVQDTGGGTDTDYSGITTFTATDPLAEIENQGMAGYDYTWQGAGYENGVKVFVKVSFTALGLQTIIASDTLDGSITGLVAVMVVAADVKLVKEPKFSIASSGEAIQFRICWSNYSSATAASFTITDAVPMGTSYVPEAASLMFCGAGGPATPNVVVAYGTASATTPGTFNTLTSPTQTAPASARWLRWTIQDVYVHSTGCVCFRARVE